MPENPFQQFKTSLEITQLCVLIYVRFSRSLRNAEDLLNEPGTQVCTKASVSGSINSGPFSQARSVNGDPKRCNKRLTGAGTGTNRSGPGALEIEQRTETLREFDAIAMPERNNSSYDFCDRREGVQVARRRTVTVDKLWATIP